MQNIIRQIFLANASLPLFKVNFLRANCCGRVQIRIVVHLIPAFVDVIIKKGNQFSFSVHINYQGCLQFFLMVYINL